MKRTSKRLQILLAVALLLYACGYLTQFIGNYAVWQKKGGMPGGTSPPFPSMSPPACLKGILWFPYSLYCMAGCAAAVTAIFLYRKLFSQNALTDSERNFDFSAKGTYGTSGWMQPREVPAVLDMVSDLSKHTGTVLGMLDGKFLCIPEKTRMNGNLAVYGASGSMKTRSFCMNRILQSAARGESLIICDPKSELYEKSSEYMRDLGYTVRVFNLVSPENSDSWNCLKEIEGQELMAQLFVDVIIKNTNGTGKSDRFWDSGEMNLLKALVLYVDLTYPPEQRNIGEVYNLITQCSESQLDSLFDVLPLTPPPPKRRTACTSGLRIRCAVVLSAGWAAGCRCSNRSLSRKSLPMTKSALNCRDNSLVRITSSPATKTAPLIFWHRCSCPLPLSNSCAMPMPIAPVGGSLCRSMCWARS